MNRYEGQRLWGEKPPTLRDQAKQKIGELAFWARSIAIGAGLVEPDASARRGEHDVDPGYDQTSGQQR